MFLLFVALGVMLNLILLTGTYIYSILSTGSNAQTSVTHAGFISFIYGLAMTLILGAIWRFVALRHKDYMTQFFTAASGIRFLSVLAVLGGCYIAVGREAMAPYALILLLFYIVNIGLHTAFFSLTTNKIQ